MNNLGFDVKKFEGATKRYCQTLDLKSRPELIDAYRKLHSREGVWQQVLDNIRDAGILEMEIYLLGNRLFMIVEMPADLSWDEAMERMAAAPQQKEWEILTAQYQHTDPTAKSHEKWELMERIFHLYD